MVKTKSYMTVYFLKLINDVTKILQRNRIKIVFVNLMDFFICADMTQETSLLNFLSDILFS